MTEIQRALNTCLPGNLRHQPKQLIPWFGYDNLARFVGEVEIATLQVLGEIGVIPAREMEVLAPKLIENILSISTTEVDIVEREITKHDIRAWVRLAQEVIAGPLACWVHIPLTSYDPLDTGRSLQFARAYQGAIKPAIKEVGLLMAELVQRFASQLQIGRTHGQHALPITVGFWLATILSRILYNAEKIKLYASQLEGKISGAVGAYNAIVGLGIAKRCGQKTFEERVLEKLGLKPARISTQILPPEPLAYFLFSCCMLSASLAQLGRDGRHLMRSEIAEVAEAFEVGQVGSSTMAHKRNPRWFENLEGMWTRTKNEFGKVMDILISEHQRDLVGSSVARDFPIILVNLMEQLNVLRRQDKSRVPFLRRLTVNTESCQRNFSQSAHLILAEPIYIALQMAGYQGDAHELVNRQAVPIAQKDGQALIKVLEKMANEDEKLAEVLERIPKDVYKLFVHPERYTGDAETKAQEIAALACRLLAEKIKERRKR